MSLTRSCVLTVYLHKVLGAVSYSSSDGQGVSLAGVLGQVWVTR